MYNHSNAHFALQIDLYVGGYKKQMHPPTLSRMHLVTLCREHVKKQLHCISLFCLALKCTIACFYLTSFHLLTVSFFYMQISSNFNWHITLWMEISLRRNSSVNLEDSAGIKKNRHRPCKRIKTEISNSFSISITLHNLSDWSSHENNARRQSDGRSETKAQLHKKKNARQTEN